MKPIPITSILLSTVITLWLVTASQPLRPGPINVTRDQYNAALAKWNSLRISDYEETIREPSFGSWRFDVYIDRTSGKPVETVTRFEGLDGTATSNSDANYVKSMTVGAVFHDLDDFVRDPFRHDVIEISGGGPEYSSIDVILDPAMGYPDSFAVLNYFSQHSGVDDSVTTLLSLDVQVLR